MKRLSKLTAIILAVIMLMTSVSAFAKTSKSPYINKTYTHNSKFDKCTVLDGLDLSSHNGTVDWNAVKSAGTDFVILRAGVRGYGSSGSYMSDKKFEEYIKAAHNKGLKIGVYFYSQALNTTEAKKEAEYTLDIIKSYKSWINLPVYYDYEFAEVSTGRLDSAYQTWYKNGTHKRIMTDNAKAFCSTVAKAGYKAGIYGNLDFFKTKYYISELENTYSMWLAHYISSSAVKTSYTGVYDMWQYSSSGYIGSKKFDVNFLYEGVNNKSMSVAAIANQGYTGSAIKPAPVVKCSSATLKSGTDYEVTYSNNVKVGTATVKITFEGNYSSYSPITTTFRIVPKKIANSGIDELEDDAITISWQKHADCDGYQVLYKENGSNWIIAGITKELTYSLKDLSPASDYEISVRAYKKVGTIVYYGILADSIYAATRPVKVTGLKVSKKAPNYLTLTWDKQQYATKYEIYQYNPASNKYELAKAVQPGSTNSTNITNLKPNTQYYFKIKAIKFDKNDNEFMGELSNRTTNYTSVNIPTPKTAVSNSYKKITYKFKKVSAASGYQVQWSTSKSFSSNTKKQFVAANKSSVKLTTAKSRKKYYVRIRAYRIRNGKKYYSPWSSKLSVKTK